MNNDRALILDFGGVVTRTLFETHDMTEEALGLPPGTLAWKGPFAPETDSLWVAMQNNELSEREYWTERTREVGKLVGQEWSEMSEFVSAARGNDPAAVIRPEALEAIDAAKSRGSRIAILSNELDLFYGAEFRRKLPLFAQFDVVTDATYSGILKPDARAYLQCTGELDVEPERCVFVDDQQRNIVGAGRVGLRSVLFDVRQPGESFKRALDLLSEN